VFLVKNILAIGMSIRDIHEFFMDISEVIVPSIKHKLEHEEVLELELMEQKRIGPFSPVHLLGDDNDVSEVTPRGVSFAGDEPKT